MQHRLLTRTILGLVCGLGLADADVAPGQDRTLPRQNRPAFSRRGGRRLRKPGEVITRPDRSVYWADQLEVGGVAPEFTLPLLPDGGSLEPAAGKRGDSRNAGVEQAGRTVSLHDLRATQPVVLIFGSMTCPPFRGQLTRVDDVYEQFKDQARFLFVYVREAHPDSILSVVGEDGQQTLQKIPQPTDQQTRTATAATCQRTARLKIPVAVDTIDNSVGKAYAAKPNRMVVVGTDGTILFATPPSPRGTDAQLLREWLAANLAGSGN